MRQPRVNNREFIEAIAAETGLQQSDILNVLNTGADIIVENLRDGIATMVFQGMVIYPSTYAGEIKFPRARFGKFFKSFGSVR